MHVNNSMYNTPTYFDDVISSDLHKNVSDWCLGVKWYSGLLQLVHQNDYDPKEQNKLSQVVKSMWRHPIGWNDASTQQRNPLIYDLWTQINNSVFNGKADLNGLPEGISGLGTKTRNIEALRKISVIAPRLQKDMFVHTDEGRFSDGQDFYTKYNCPRDKIAFTCYLNAREGLPIAGHSRSGINNTGILGSIHKDSGPDVAKEDAYYTVLFIANTEWQPSWGGEFVYYDDVENAETQWKYKYNIGYPNQIIGNRPGRIVVYPHHATHRTFGCQAPTPSYRIAFRVKLN